VRGLPLLCLLAACQFNPDTQATREDGAVVDPADASPFDARIFPDSAPPPDAVANCVAGTRQCVGRVLETCNATGTGLDPSLAQTCSFACVDDDHCIGASNVSAETVAMCDGQSLPLAPGATATIHFVNQASPEISCAPDCGDGTTTTIPAQARVSQSDGPDLAVFCLSLLELPAGLTLSAEDNLEWTVVLLVKGEAVINGSIDLSGGDGQSNARGIAGPGGGEGGPLHNDNSRPGEGACPGEGGVRGGDSGARIGGGGGGGGFGGVGGAGGEGQSTNNGDIGSGGATSAVCGQVTLIPLIAGSGGGSGGDGTGGMIGWAGGGGGGSIQISAATSLQLGGSILSRGGQGFYDSGGPLGGGGGGGSGGGVLLEAPSLTIAGSLVVDGGDGAEGSAGAGGAGGTGTTFAGQAGANQDGSGESGAGGGGGGGRVRLNATVAPTLCGQVSPTTACTSGVLSP